MQNSGASPHQNSSDSSNTARDAQVPGFVASSLIAGLPFLGLMMIAAIASGQDQVGRLVSLLGILLVEGLCMAFFWRRVHPTAGKSFAAAIYAVGLWAFMVGCLVTTFGLRFGGMGDLARHVAYLGSGVVAVSGFFFGIVWAQSQAPRLMLQTHSLMATSLVLAGFTALLLKTGVPAAAGPGDTVHAAVVPASPQDHGDPGHNGGLGEHGATLSGSGDSPDPREGLHPAPPRAEARAEGGKTPHGGHAQVDRAPDGDPRGGGHPIQMAEDHRGQASQDQHSSPDPGDDGDDEGPAAAKTRAWSYEGASGPAAWGNIKADWQQCAAGREQSPIDIAKGSKESRRVVSLAYTESPARVASNGELLQVFVGRGSHAIINGQAYELKRIDFHAPSEHKLSGVSYPMEIQFVHTDSKGGTAIISAFVEKGRDNAELGKILASLPIRAGVEKSLKAEIDLGRVLPRGQTVSAQQYRGSLTMPPCTEGISWTVLKTPLRLSGDQLTLFRSHFGGSNRPIQPLGKRHMGPPERAAVH